jgi:hypothetical protein
MYDKPAAQFPLQGSSIQYNTIIVSSIILTFHSISTIAQQNTDSFTHARIYLYVPIPIPIQLIPIRPYTDNGVTHLSLCFRSVRPSVLLIPELVAIRILYIMCVHCARMSVCHHVIQSPNHRVRKIRRLCQPSPYRELSRSVSPSVHYPTASRSHTNHPFPISVRAPRKPWK